MQDIRNIKSWLWIYQHRKRGDIYDDIKQQIARDNYWKCVWDVAIIEKKNILRSDHLLDDDIEIKTWEFYITVESSRGSKLFRKYIPKKVLPLFVDIIDKANADWKYRSYKFLNFIK